MAELDSGRPPEMEHLSAGEQSLRRSLDFSGRRWDFSGKCRLTQFYLIIGVKATFFPPGKAAPGHISKCSLAGGFNRQK
jgi:hypothetical protein